VGHLIEAIKEHVELYRRLGFCVIPAPLGSKHPVLSWMPYQQRLPTEEEIAEWFGREQNIAIVCGKVSGNLVVLDFDDVGVYEKFFDSKKIEAGTMVVRTGGGKRHIYMRSSEPVPSFKVPQLRLEVRSDGNVIIAPPSIHPSGQRYEFVSETRSVPQLHNFLDEFWSRVERLGVKPYEIADRELEHFEIHLTGKRWKGRSPPCITKLLKGVGEGFRNEAAARIASYYLHIKGYGVAKAWKAVQRWNPKNTPPLEISELKNVFLSIGEGGYTYLCRSLAPFCERERCSYIKWRMCQRTVEKLMADEEPHAEGDNKKSREGR
jgi:hypothetical protein